MANQPLFSLNSLNNADLTVSVSSSPKYSFGFTGWKNYPSEEVEEVDEFDEWVRETRKAAGIVDPEPERKKILYPVGQILWSGTIKVTNPRFHVTITNITPATKSADSK